MNVKLQMNMKNYLLLPRNYHKIEETPSNLFPKSKMLAPISQEVIECLDSNELWTTYFDDAN